MATGNQDGVKIVRTAITQNVANASNEMLTVSVAIPALSSASGALVIAGISPVPTGINLNLNYFDVEVGASGINQYAFGKNGVSFWNGFCDIQHTSALNSLSAYRYVPGDTIFISITNNDAVARTFFVNIGLYVVNV